jgi:hypothetical protein
VLRLALGARHFNVEVPSPTRVRVGDEVDCYLPAARLHGFDAASGESLALRSWTC